MKKLPLVLATLTALAAPRPSSGCDFGYSAVFPAPDVVRLTGSVVGYVPISSTPAMTIPTLSPSWQAAGLRIAVREVVSGPVTGAEAVVAVLPYASDCRSIAATREMLERDYPVGSAVAVRGKATGTPATPVIAELNQQQFVVKIPDTIPRNPQGDLDYRSWRVVGNLNVVDFEFDRTVLTLPRGRDDRYARLRNLVLYPGWSAMPGAPGRYQQLVIESGLGTREQADLLDQFQQLHPFVK